MNNKRWPLLEACVASAEEAVAAVRGGADRLELCTELEVGGLTPPVGLLEETRAALEATGAGRCPVFCMVRPREGAFTASGSEVIAMAAQAASLLRAGADGLVIGVLRDDQTLDAEAVATLVRSAQGCPVTFHRAFDLIREPLPALEVLGALGVHRVLTAGGPASAWEGRRRLRRLVAAGHGGRGKPLILGAGGIRADHAVALVAETGLTEVHARGAAFPRLAQVLGRSV